MISVCLFVVLIRCHLSCGCGRRPCSDLSRLWLMFCSWSDDGCGVCHFGDVFHVCVMLTCYSVCLQCCAMP